MCQLLVQHFFNLFTQFKTPTKSHENYVFLYPFLNMAISPPNNKKIIILGFGNTGKWLQENIIFMRFCCCFKQSKKTEKLSNQQPTHAIAKCILTGLVQQAKKSHWKWDLKSRMCISHNIASSFHCHTCQLEFKMPLPPAKKTTDPDLHKGNTGSQTLD